MTAVENACIVLNTITVHFSLLYIGTRQKSLLGGWGLI